MVRDDASLGYDSMTTIYKPVTLALFLMVSFLFLAVEVSFAEGGNQFAQLTGEDCSYVPGHKIVALSPF
jgi:hypothetical protein